MCGRYTQHSPTAVVADRFGASLPVITLPARYNISPGSDILICRAAGQDRMLSYLRWGLVPPWSKDPKTGYKMINARAETVDEKPAFRAAFRRRRCLIAADGFYEWRTTAPRKQPYAIRLASSEPFAMAGLWEHWEQQGQVIESCSIIVTSANELVRPIHDRMPVILAPADYARWLDPTTQDVPMFKALLRPYPAEAMTAYPVSTRVNAPRNDDAGLLAPLPA